MLRPSSLPRVRDGECFLPATEPSTPGPQLNRRRLLRRASGIMAAWQKNLAVFTLRSSTGSPGLTNARGPRRFETCSTPRPHARGSPRHRSRCRRQYITPRWWIYVQILSPTSIFPSSVPPSGHLVLAGQDRERKTQCPAGARRMGQASPCAERYPAVGAHGNRWCGPWDQPSTARKAVLKRLTSAVSAIRPDASVPC